MIEIHEVCELLCEEDNGLAGEDSVYWWLSVAGAFLVSEVMPFLGLPDTWNGILHGVLGMCLRRTRVKDHKE